jgi:hypothetical protein
MELDDELKQGLCTSKKGNKVRIYLLIYYNNNNNNIFILTFISH